MHKITLILSLIAIGGADIALAQNDGALEEIIVTAQRRAESLQEVPIAITAFTSEALERSRITSMEDVVTRTPNFTMTGFNAGQPRLFIRGIGSTDDGAAQDNSVAVFVDDVYIGRGTGQASEIYDLARVEVLRGPQGTLYGKNVVGGVVNLVSARPDQETEFKTDLTLGDYDLLEFKAMLNGAITDKTSARVSLISSDRSGYGENIVTGSDLDDRQFLGVRGKILYEHSETFQMLLSGDYSEHSDNGVTRKGVTGDFGGAPFGSVTAVQTSLDPRVSETPRDTFQKIKLAGFSAHLTWTKDWGTVTSITAFRNSDGEIQDAFTGISSPPYALLDTRNYETDVADQFSQELRLAFGGGDSKFSGVAGVYYLAEDVDRVEVSDLESAIGEALPFVLGGLLGSSGTWQEAQNDSLGVFASVSYEFSDRWSGTVGGRYSSDEKTIATEVRELRDGGGGEFGFIAAPPTETYSIAAKDDWNAFTPSVSLAFAASDQSNFYLSVSKGFKSGGFQGQAPTARAAETPFDPEFAWNVELGAKTTWFDDRLMVNAAIFTTEYEDLQVRQNATTPDNPLPVLRVTNAADAEASGIEIDFIARPIPQLDIWGSFSVLDTEFQNFIDNTGLDVSGNSMLFSPETQYNVGIQYTADSGFFARVEYRFQDEYFDDPANLNVHKHESNGLLDAGIGMSFAEGRWEVELWGKNITDELYTTHNIPFLGDRFVLWGAPATYGLTLKYRP
jgi:iron complex outermembrane receptor protein